MRTPGALPAGPCPRDARADTVKPPSRERFALRRAWSDCCPVADSTALTLLEKPHRTACPSLDAQQSGMPSEAGPPPWSSPPHGSRRRPELQGRGLSQRDGRATPGMESRTPRLWKAEYTGTDACKRKSYGAGSHGAQSFRVESAGAGSTGAAPHRPPAPLGTAQWVGAPCGGIPKGAGPRGGDPQGGILHSEAHVGPSKMGRRPVVAGPPERIQ